jgi:hypothetical protein
MWPFTVVTFATVTSLQEAQFMVAVAGVVTAGAGVRNRRCAPLTWSPACALRANAAAMDRAMVDPTSVLIRFIFIILFFLVRLVYIRSFWTAYARPAKITCSLIAKSWTFPAVQPRRERRS